MSMKRFLNRSNRDDKDKEKDKEKPHVFISNDADTASIRSNGTGGSRDSLTGQQMFEEEGRGSYTGVPGESPQYFKFDAKLNLNPSIQSKPTSVYTKDLDYMGKSIFSKARKTLLTTQLSYFSGLSSGQTGKKDSSMMFSQPLQIMNIAEEGKEDGRTPVKSIEDKLQGLYDDLAFVMNQFQNCNVNLTTAVINSIDCFKKFILFIEQLGNDATETSEWHFTTYNNSNLRKIMKIYLNFYDNLLKDEVYIKLKLLLVKNFNDFSQTLNTADENQPPQSIIKPQNYAIGINEGVALPNEDILSRIIEKISKTFISIKEQKGHFITPIARGISADLNILCLYFGYPNPTDYHTKLTQSLHGLYDDIHIVVMKNQIELAATGTTQPQDSAISKLAHLKSYHATAPLENESYPNSRANLYLDSSANFIQPTTPQRFKLPFRIPTDNDRPPMSLSLSIENSSRTSGTMGGYIYPIIDLVKQPHLESYTNSKFAISCGHVCLDTTTGGASTTEYPHVSAPLSVLIYLYKQALMAQYKKVVNSNNGGEDIIIAESKAAYGSVLKQVEEMFPLKRVRVVDPKTKKESYELRNLPKTRFGQIIWGERTLINVSKDEKSKDLGKKLSDLAIIKVNKTLQCDQNFLGDDVPFNEFDPALMFDNLYVRKVIDLKRQSPKTMDLNLDEVDSDLSSENSRSETGPPVYNGLPVFKYGSTTKFTKGNLNGIKLVYWLDGAIHSSEFIVNSVENNSAFAAGGDSGSWILTKLEDIEPNSKGLGVVGMLHSYDGEFKQFGLYTPMSEILTRLKEVTGIQWGVVGVAPEKGRVDENFEGESSEEEDSEAESSDNGESDFEGSAFSPEID